MNTRATEPSTSESRFDPDTRAGLRPAPEARSAPGDDGPHRGHTYIDDSVISTIARLAAEQVEGVHQIGEPTLRGWFGRLGRPKHAGVDSDVGLKEAAIDIEVVVDFGYPMRNVADNLRHHIIETVEAMTGRNVVEVNVYLVDVHVPKATARSRRHLE